MSAFETPPRSSGRSRSPRSVRSVAGMMPPASPIRQLDFPAMLHEFAGFSPHFHGVPASPAHAAGGEPDHAALSPVSAPSPGHSPAELAAGIAAPMDVDPDPVILDDDDAEPHDPEDAPPEGAGADGEGAAEKASGTKTYHMVLRLGLKKGFYQKTLRRHDAPFALTPEACGKWQESDKTARTFTVGRTSRARDAEDGMPTLRYQLPSSMCKIQPPSQGEDGAEPGDFIHGYEAVTNAVDWIRNYIAAPRNLSNGDQDVRIGKLTNYIIAPQLDIDGEGAHVHLAIRGKAIPTIALAKLYADTMVSDFMVAFYGLAKENQPASANYTVAISNNWKQRCGYTCHGHQNPWPAIIHGSAFACFTQTEWFEVFVKWQDIVHQKLHIRGPEADRELLRTGAEHVAPTVEELCIRDVEDLIGAGVVLVLTNDRLSLTPIQLGRALKEHKKGSHAWYARANKQRKDTVIQAVLCRNAPTMQEPVRQRYDLQTFTNVPAEITQWLDTNVRGERKDRYPFLVVLDEEGGRGKTQFFLAQEQQALYFKLNVNWSTWNARREGKRFVILDDVPLFGDGSNLNSETRLKAILQGSEDFDVVSKQGAHAWHCVHGIPCVILTNDAELVHSLERRPWFRNHGIYVTITEPLFAAPAPAAAEEPAAVPAAAV